MASSDKTPEADAHAVSSLIMRLSNRAQRWGINRTLQMEGRTLSFPQIRILYLVRHGVTSPSEIARRLQVTPRAVTSIVDQLQEAGMLRRKHDENDRRRVELILTPEGRRISIEVEHVTLGPMDQRIAQLEPADRLALEHGLEVLATILDELIADTV